MPEKYTKEEYWKLYEKLPEELREAIFSVKTADSIYNICQRNEILDERVSEIAKHVGDVLVGVLPPDELQKTLEEEVKLKKDLAKKVAQEINRFIFYPVKSSLESLYKIEIVPVGPPEGRPPEAPPTEEEKPAAPEEGEPRLRRAAPEKPDVYREEIE